MYFVAKIKPKYAEVIAIKELQMWLEAKKKRAVNLIFGFISRSKGS